MDTSGELPHVQWLRKSGACRPGLAFAARYPTMKAVWESCERTDWLLWLIDKAETRGTVPSGTHFAAARANYLAVCAAVAVDAEMPVEITHGYGRAAVRALHPGCPVTIPGET